MIHLFRHQRGKLKGKYDIVLLSKGKVIVFSNQGYSRKSGALKAMRTITNSIWKGFERIDVFFQDDTLEQPKIYCLSDDMGTYITNLPSHKPYHP